MKSRSPYLPAALVILGAACSSGSDEAAQASNEYCHTVWRPGAASTCTGCTGVEAPASAFDGSFDTAASMAAGAQGTFSGTTAPQIAGSVAGVTFTFPDLGEGVSISITTYQGDAQQEAAGPASRGGGLSDVCPPGMDCTFTQGSSFVGLATSKDYDRIVAVISNSGTSGLLINELCVR